MSESWIDAGRADAIGREDVVRFDHAGQTYAIYRTADDRYYATDGLCTHAAVHLAGGFVMEHLIECPKHNGRFHLADGSPARAPICRGLATYPVEIRNGRIFLRVSTPGGAGARPVETLRLKVLEARSVATFIREITLQPEIQEFVVVP